MNNSSKTNIFIFIHIIQYPSTFANRSIFYSENFFDGIISTAPLLTIIIRGELNEKIIIIRIFDLFTDCMWF